MCPEQSFQIQVVLNHFSSVLLPDFHLLCQALHHLTSSLMLLSCLHPFRTLGFLLCLQHNIHAHASEPLLLPGILFFPVCVIPSPSSGVCKYFIFLFLIFNTVPSFRQPPHSSLLQFIHKTQHKDVKQSALTLGCSLKKNMQIRSEKIICKCQYSDVFIISRKLQH